MAPGHRCEAKCVIVYTYTSDWFRGKNSQPSMVIMTVYNLRSGPILAVLIHSLWGLPLKFRLPRRTGIFKAKRKFILISGWTVYRTVCCVYRWKTLLQAYPRGRPSQQTWISVRVLVEGIVTVFSSRIHSNATKLFGPYLDKMTKFCSAVQTRFLFFWLSPKIVQIQYVLAHCAVNLSFMVLFTCVFSFWILLNPFKFRGNFIQNFQQQPICL